MKLRKGLMVLSLLSAIFASGAAPVNAQDKKQVMTTFYPVYYLTQRIAGDKAEVKMLLDANQDAHDYETSARDVATIQQADAFIYQDDEMEHFVPDVIKMLDTDKTQVVKSTEGIELLKGEAHEDDAHDHESEESHESEAHDHDHDHDHAHEFDPHTWMDPMVYAKQAENIKNALIQVDPDNKETYEANTQQLVEELTVLDAEFREQLATRDNKVFVVQHAAFGYLAHAYGLTQEAITGISSTEEPSAAVLAQMQSFVKEHQVDVIYVEPALDTAIAKVVADASGAELRPLRTLESLTEEERAKGEDYFTVMRANLAELTK
ncbi:MAG: zinc ABC transporter substrate-binding protein [Aerococcaceae bacterium]|nr:zinc ABC transporter substrate-binding protein [Aerococcaceae bacterium]